MSERFIGGYTHLTGENPAAYARRGGTSMDPNENAGFEQRHGRDPMARETETGEDVSHLHIANEFLGLKDRDPEEFRRRSAEALGFDRQLRPDTTLESVQEMELKLTKLMSSGDVDPGNLPGGSVSNLYEQMGKLKWEAEMKRRTDEIAAPHGYAFGSNEYNQIRKRVEEDFRKSTSADAKIERNAREITEATDQDIDKARRNFTQLAAQAKLVIDNVHAGRLQIVNAENREKLEQIAGLLDNESRIANMSLYDIKTNTLKLLDVNGVNLRQYFKEAQKEEKSNREKYMPHSLEDLADLIVGEFETGDFGAGGKYEILDARGEVRKENLMAWFRSRVIALHQQNPDGDINPFNEIRIPTVYRDISLNEMTSVPRFRQKRETVITGVEGGQINMEYRNVKSNEYSQLMDEILMQAWMVGTAHNGDAQYRQKRGSEKELFGVINGIYANNVFLKDRGRLLRLLKLAKTDKYQLDKVLNEGDQGDVGKGVQKGLLAYYYMAELAEPEPDPAHPEKGGLRRTDNMFFKNLGEDGTKYFFQSIGLQLLNGRYESFTDAAGDLTGRPNTEVDVSTLIRIDPAQVLSRLKGNQKITLADLQLFESDPEKFAMNILGKEWGMARKDLNIFDNVKKQQRVTDLVRTAITDAIGQSLNLDENDREFAGLIPFLMRNWTGFAARNDTGAQGFDAWSKLINFGDYRIRQASGREGGGNRFSLFDFKRLSLTLFDGINVSVEQTDGKKVQKTLLQVLHDTQEYGQKVEDFDTEGSAMTQFAATHVNSAYNVMTFILDEQELKMDSFLKVDARGFLVFDHKAAQGIMGGPWKALRYAFDQQKFALNSPIRDWYKEYYRDPVTGEKKSRLVFKEKTLKEYFMSDDVLNIGVNHEEFHHNNINEGKIARLIFADMLSREIEAHRTWGSGYARWTIETIEEIEHFFHHVSEEVEEGEKNGRSHTLVTRSFFTHHEWAAILLAFNSSYGKMYTTLFLQQAALGLGGAFLKALLETFKQVVPVPKP